MPVLLGEIAPSWICTYTYTVYVRAGDSEQQNTYSNRVSNSLNFYGRDTVKMKNRTVLYNQIRNMRRPGEIFVQICAQ